MTENRTVARVRKRPAAKVSKESEGVPVNGDVGLGNEALAAEPFALPDPVFKNQPVVGRGGGRTKTDVVKAI